MPKVTRVRPRIGDAIEIETPKGFAYAHYTHADDQYGALLRVFEEFHSSRPEDFSRLVESRPQFTAFIPLGSACFRGVMRVVAEEGIAPPTEFPTFRAGIPGKDGKVQTWWLWDGGRDQFVGSLQPGMEAYPIRSVWTETLLIERIVKGWRHEHCT